MNKENFLALFTNPLFVSIPNNGGAVLHSHNITNILNRNTDQLKEGAYFTVNGFANFVEGEFHGRRKDKVTSFNCNFLDIDLTPEKKRTEAEIIYKELCEKGLQPTAIVLTGKGLHVYWIYEQPIPFSQRALDEYDVLQLAIVDGYSNRGADPQARDAARVLRIPEAKYFDKQGNYTCDVELLYLNPDVKYTPTQIATYFKNTIKAHTKAGQDMLRLGDEFDMSTIINVKSGSRHHDSYSAALSIIQRSKDLASARKMYQAILSTWEPPLDWTDYWKQFEAAKSKIEKDRPNAFIGDPLGEAPIPTIISAANVEMKRIEWLWEGFIAKGKPHMLTGEPGLGKSQITLDIAARLSTGTQFPSVTLGQGFRKPVGVLILSAEDDIADTMVPRLIAAKADLKNIAFLSSSILEVSKDKRSKIRSLALRDDAEQILKAIATLPIEIGLIIIDPISAFLSSKQDSNSNSDARGTLAQLQHTIMDKGIALLIINHTNKNTAAKSAHMRSMGSVGWNAAARATFYVFPDEMEGRRVFSIGKTNLAKESGKGFFYRVTEETIQILNQPASVPRIEWDLSAFPTKGADDYVASGDRVKSKGSDCEEELKRFMFAKGTIPSAEGVKFMKERGYSQAEIYRSARKLDIIGEYGKWTENLDDQ